jgi:hypothetical protein
VTTVMNLRVLYKEELLLTVLTTISFWLIILQK